MGYFARYLRTRKSGNVTENVVKDKVKKKQFAEEIEALLDPSEIEATRKRNLEELVLKSHREPTVKEVLEELARQAKRLRSRRPNAKLVCSCGAYAMALLAGVRSYPEHMLGIHIMMDKRVPPWDTVVMYADHKGKREGGVL